MKKYTAFLLMIMMISGSLNAADPAKGQELFKSRCAACHAVDQKLVGPALMGVDKRYDEKWIVSFIQSSQTLIKAGDAKAVKIFNDMNKVVMPDHKDLTEADIRGILAFIKQEEANLAKTEIVTPVNMKSSKKPVAPGDWWFFTALGLFVFFLLLVLNVMINAVNVLSKFDKAQAALKTETLQVNQEVELTEVA
jgi:cytochrome c2